MEVPDNLRSKQWFFGDLGRLLLTRGGVAQYRDMAVKYDNPNWVVYQTDYRPLHRDLSEELEIMLYGTKFAVLDKERKVVEEFSDRNEDPAEGDRRYALIWPRVQTWLEQGYTFRAEFFKNVEELTGYNKAGVYRPGGYTAKIYEANNVHDLLLDVSSLLLPLEAEERREEAVEYKKEVLRLQKTLPQYYPRVIADLILDYI